MAGHPDVLPGPIGTHPRRRVECVIPAANGGAIYRPVTGSADDRAVSYAPGLL